MTSFIAVTMLVLSVAWLPLALRFFRGWRSRRNPVSLAICAFIGLAVYTDVLLVLALTGQTTWRFFTIATRAFDAIVVMNFYWAFLWSEKRFPEARRVPLAYSIPPTNKTTTPRPS